MPKGPERLQPKLPGFENSEKIKGAQRRALDPPKENKEKSQLYQFPKGTPITWKFRSFYGDSIDTFQAEKILNQKKNGLQAWRLIDGVRITKTTRKNHGDFGYIPANEIVGMYTRGDFSPKKVK